VSKWGLIAFVGKLEFSYISCMIRCAILLLLNPILMYGQWDFNPNFNCKSYYDSGKILSEIVYRSGSRNGSCTYYFENGNKHSESYYLNGILKGKYKIYYESGEYVYDKNNINSRKNGSWKTYTSKGEIKDAEIGC